MTTLVDSKAVTASADKKDLDSFIDLLTKCAEPDAKPTDVKALREKLKAFPALWNWAGDLSTVARTTILEKGINASHATLETTRMGMKLKEKELGIETASPLEQCLIRQIVTCWLDLSIVEIQRARMNAYDAKTSIETSEYWDRKLSNSQRRYLRAIESLARVRRLIRPEPNPIQVNIGEKQVNVTSNK